MHTSFSAINVKELLTPNTLHGSKTASQLPSSKSGVADAASIGLLTPGKTQVILNQQLAEKLQQRFKEEGIELNGLQAEDFSPEKVSERILGFVSSRVLSEQDQAKQAELMQQAREGIEQGFSEARDILESLDVLNGKIKEDVDTTYDLIQQGMDRLQKQVDGTLQDKDDDVAMAQIQQTSMAHHFSRNENTHVEIITRDGDKVLIDLFKQQSGQLSRTMLQTEDGTTYSATRHLSVSSGTSYQVQGELDKEEQKAIDELLKDVAKISDSFFAGNVQKAFKTAAKMGFDGEELSRFSLSLDYQERRQVAISAYSQHQTQESENSSKRDEQSNLKSMGDFVKQMEQLFQNPFALKKFAHPEQSISDLFKDMNQLLHSEEMKQLERGSTSLLDSLVEQIKQNNSRSAMTSTAGNI